MDVNEHTCGATEEEAHQRRDQQHQVPEPNHAAPEAKLDQWAVDGRMGFVCVRLAVVRQHHYRADNDKEQNNQQSDDEDDVRIVVLNANTVVDPGTVMIESLHAPVARRAVL